MKRIPTFQQFINESTNVPDYVLDFAKRKSPLATKMVKKAASWAEKSGIKITAGALIERGESVFILDTNIRKSIYINLDNETIEFLDTIVNDIKSFKRALDKYENE
jgi:hypothetical protein